MFGILLLPVVKAETGQYEQHTNRLNPFLFSVDTIYSMSSYDYYLSNDSFHEVILDDDNYYVFYIRSGLVSYNMTVWIQLSDGSGHYLREDCGIGEYELLMMFKPEKTGLFEIIISNRNYDISGDPHTDVDEIGILEVPIYDFNYNIDYDQYEAEIQEKWDSERIVFGIIQLEKSVDYNIYHGYKVYLKYLSYYSIGSDKLNEDSFETQYTEGDIINVPTKGYYLFYESVGNPIEIHYKDLDIDDSWIIRNMFFIIMIPITVIGVIVGYIIFKKKHPKEPTIQTKEFLKITYCPECGIKITDMTKDYCSKCGSKIIK